MQEESKKTYSLTPHTDINESRFVTGQTIDLSPQAAAASSQTNVSDENEQEYAQWRAQHHSFGIENNVSSMASSSNGPASSNAPDSNSNRLMYRHAMMVVENAGIEQKPIKKVTQKKKQDRSRQGTGSMTNSQRGTARIQDRMQRQMIGDSKQSTQQSKSSAMQQSRTGIMNIISAQHGMITSPRSTFARQGNRTGMPRSQYTNKLPVQSPTATPKVNFLHTDGFLHISQKEVVKNQGMQQIRKNQLEQFAYPKDSQKTLIDKATGEASNGDFQVEQLSQITETVQAAEQQRNEQQKMSSNTPSNEVESKSKMNRRHGSQFSKHSDLTAGLKPSHSQPFQSVMDVHSKLMTPGEITVNAKLMPLQNAEIRNAQQQNWVQNEENTDNTSKDVQKIENISSPQSALEQSAQETPEEERDTPQLMNPSNTAAVQGTVLSPRTVQYPRRMNKFIDSHGAGNSVAPESGVLTHDDNKDTHEVDSGKSGVNTDFALTSDGKGNYVMVKKHGTNQQNTGSSNQAYSILSPKSLTMLPTSPQGYFSQSGLKHDYSKPGTANMQQRQNRRFRYTTSMQAEQNIQHPISSDDPTSTHNRELDNIHVLSQTHSLDRAQGGIFQQKPNYNMKNPHQKNVRRASAGAIGRFSTIQNQRIQAASKAGIRSNRQQNGPISPELKEKTVGYIKASNIVQEAAKIRLPKADKNVRIPDFLKSHIETSSKFQESFISMQKLPSSTNISSRFQYGGQTERSQKKMTIAEMSMAWEALEKSKAQMEAQQITSLHSEKDTFNITDLLIQTRKGSQVPHTLTTWNTPKKTTFDGRLNSMPPNNLDKKQITNALGLNRPLHVNTVSMVNPNIGKSNATSIAMQEPVAKSLIQLQPTNIALTDELATLQIIETQSSQLADSKKKSVSSLSSAITPPNEPEALKSSKTHQKSEKHLELKPTSGLEITSNEDFGGKASALERKPSRISVMKDAEPESPLEDQRHKLRRRTIIALNDSPGARHQSPWHRKQSIIQTIETEKSEQMPVPHDNKAIKSQKMTLVNIDYQLKSRFDGQALPLSVDRIAQSTFEKVIQKLDGTFEWEQVAEINMAGTNEVSFIPLLHNVDKEKMDMLERKMQHDIDQKAKESKKMQYNSIGGLLVNSIGQSSHHSSRKEVGANDETDPTKVSGTTHSESTVLETPAFSEMEQSQMQSEQETGPDIPQPQTQITNPLFRLENRPNVTETLYKDVMRVFTGEKDVNIWQNRVEDYLDDTRRLTEDENISYEVQLAHDLLEGQEYVEVSERNKYTQRRRERCLSIIEELKSDEAMSVSENRNRYIFSSMAGSQFSRSPTLKQLSQSLSKKSPTRKESTKSQKYQENYVGNPDIRDIALRRVVFNLYEACSLTTVSIKLQMDFEAILKLQRKRPEYNHRVCNTLPLMLYDDFMTECLVFQKTIQTRRLAETDPIKCVVLMKNNLDKRVQVTGQVLAYLEDMQMFIVEAKGKRYLFNRLCVQFSDLEAKENIEARRVEAMQLGKMVFLRVNIEHVVFEEVLKMRPELRQPAFITNNIERLLGLKRMKQLHPTRTYDKELIRDMVEQFEALYCYSVCKSIIMTEADEDNPKFACMITGYTVQRNSMESKPYYALDAYERNRGPINHLIGVKQAKEVLKDYSLLGRKCFYHSLKFINRMKLDILDETPVFQEPISDEIAYQICGERIIGKTFKHPSLFKKEISNYPLTNLIFAQAQKALSSKFNTTLVYKWQDKISQNIDKMIKKFFVGAKESKIVRSMDDLNPFIKRYLKAVNIIQVSHLHTKFKGELNQYLHFLLRFANIVDDFRKSYEYKEHKFDELSIDTSKVPLMKLKIQTEKKKFIPYKKNPTKVSGMMAFKLKIYALRPREYTYEMSSSPQLQNVKNELYNILNYICQQFQGVPKVEALLYKQLKHTNKTLFISAAQEVEETEAGSPLLKRKKRSQRMASEQSIRTDINDGWNQSDQAVDDIQMIRTNIEWIIATVTELAYNQCEQLQDHTQYLGVTFEDLLFNIRRRIYTDQLEIQFSDTELGATYDDECNADFNLSSQDLIKSINTTQISDKDYKNQYNDLKDAYWSVQKDVSAEYNFGLFVLDCTSFKSHIVQTIGSLKEKFEQHLIESFTAELYAQDEKNKDVWEKVNACHENIDYTITQIDYIAQLQSEEVFEELIQMVKHIQDRKTLLDQLNIEITEEDFDIFLNLFGYPNILQDALEVKAEKLVEEQEKISAKIKEHVSETKCVIKSFKLRFSQFHVATLQTKDEVKAGDQYLPNKAYFEDLFKMAEKDGAGDVIWDPTEIEKWCKLMEELNTDLASSEEDTRTIQRRQEALSIAIAEFPELEKLKNEAKPLIQLWEAVTQFNRVINDWREKPIAQMVIEDVEEFCSDWTRKLHFVQRSPFLNGFPGPMKFVDYILNQVERFKEYMPLLQALKVKGLEERHMKKIRIEIDDKDFNLRKTNFRQLAKHDYHKGKNLEQIKIISDLASKQYAILLTMQSVEKELETAMINAQLYKDTHSFILKDIDQDLNTFKECEVRICSIANNPYAKFYMDSIQRLLKDLKFVIDFYTHWKDVQKYWAYLLPIFQQKDIAEQMPAQNKIFDTINYMYRNYVSDLSKKKITYKNFARTENLHRDVKWMHKQFEILMRTLIKYLEAKREYFPRLYFLSNEQIIEIMGMMEDISTLERNLFKMFEGIDKFLILYPPQKLKIEDDEGAELSPSQQQILGVQGKRCFNENHVRMALTERPKAGLDNKDPDLGTIIGVHNQDGELIEFRKYLEVTTSLEKVLLNVEQEMKYAVASTMLECFHSFRYEQFSDWIKLWPTQFTLDVLNIKLTQQLEEAFVSKEINNKMMGAAVAATNRGSKSQMPVLQKKKTKLMGSPIKSAVTKLMKINPFIDKDEQEQVLANIVEQFKVIYQQLNTQITELSQMIRVQVTPSKRQSVNSLIINRVSCRDSVQNMVDAGAQTSQDFLWKIFMKYNYIERHESRLAQKHAFQVVEDTKDEDISFTKLKPQHQVDKYGKKIIRPDMLLKNLTAQKVASVKPEIYKNTSLPSNIDFQIIEAKQPYGYEFLPNSSRLVITPLTERCFQSLFLALHYRYGGAPIGPAGTGKTETCKELAKMIARYCYVFNCQSTIDFESMSKFFKGLAASGTWVCFDEFNRLEINVLSVVSQLIIIIQSAKNNESIRLTIENTNLRFEKDCALFITMNPFHLGRTPLPDNLKALFRQITMVVPDTVFISEIILYSMGFKAASKLARKITQTFQLIYEQLKGHAHYDFGLRSIKSVLLNAGQLKLRALNVDSSEKFMKETAIKRLETHVKDISKIKLKHKGRMKARLARQKNVKKYDEESDYSRKKGKQNPFEHEQKIPEDSEEDEDEDLGNESSESLQTEITPSDQTSQLGTEKEDNSEFLNSSDDISDNSSVRCANKLKEMGLDKQFLVVECGCSNFDVLMDEDLLDQFLVLKSILDRNLPKLIESDITILQNICIYVFPDIPSPEIENTNEMRSMIEVRIEEKNFHMSDEQVRNVLNIDDAVNSRHGIMVVGQPISGKTQSIKTFTDTIEKLHKREFNEKYVKFMQAKSKRMRIESKLVKRDGQEVIVLVDPDPIAEMQFKITPQEYQMILDTCKYKGIQNIILNPKSITVQQLMGFFDETSREWTDGILTYAIRKAASDVTGRRMLVTFDGPIEPDWVENMNSVLDDNKRLNLVTGETIYLTPQMNVILECSDLVECSPATISRCAIIYMRRETLPVKAHFNLWLKSLPKILKEKCFNIDSYVNYFFPDIFEKFLKPDKLIYNVSQHWAVINFLKIFEAQLSDYRNPKYTDKKYVDKIIEKINRIKEVKEKDASPNSKRRRETLDGSGDGTAIQASLQSSNQPLTASEDKGFPEPASPRSPNSADTVGSFQSQGQLLARQLSAVKSKQKNQKCKPPELLFADSETLFEQSIRNMQNWIDSFFIYSMIWAFGSILTDEGKREFNSYIKTIIAQKDARQEALSKRSVTQKSHLSQVKWSDGSSSKSSVVTKDYEPTDEFVFGSIDELKCSIPNEPDIFDLFFDISTNQWKCWKQVYNFKLEDGGGFVERVKKHVMSTVCVTQDLLRFNYLLDKILPTKQSLMLIGRTSTGKSLILKNYLTQNDGITKPINFEMVSFTPTLHGNKVQNIVESRVEVTGNKGILQPPEQKKVVFMIDDLNMSYKDKYGHSSAIELLRQWMDYGKWYNLPSIYQKQVKEICFCSTMSTRKAATGVTAQKDLVDERCAWHWIGIGVTNIENCYLDQIQRVYLKRSFGHLHGKLDAPDMIIRASRAFMEMYDKQMKPSPTTFLKRINQRHMLYILKGMIEIPSNYYRMKEHVAFIWMNEIQRTVLDRFVDETEKVLIYKQTKEIGMRIFGVTGKTFVSHRDVDEMNFCYGQGDAFYQEIPEEKKLDQALTEIVVDYNKANPREEIDIIIFNTVIEKTLKINRSLRQTCAHTILIANEGSGATELVKMAIVLAGAVDYELFEKGSEQKDDYKVSMKQMMLLVGAESKQRVCLHAQEKDLGNNQILLALDSIAAHGDLFTYFSKDEVEATISTAKINFGLTKAKQQTSSQFLQDIRQKITEDLHIIVQLNPRSNILLNEMREAYHLVNTATIIWFGEWSNSGLESVATKHLVLPKGQTEQMMAETEDIAKMPIHLNNQDKVIKQMIKMYADVRRVAMEYYDASDHFVHVSPQHFDSFCQTYKALVRKRRVKIKNHRDRFTLGLEGLVKTTKFTEAKQDELSKMSPLLVEKQKEFEVLVDKLRKLKYELGKRIDISVEAEKEITFLTEQAAAQQKICDKKMHEVIPMLNNAIEGLAKIAKADIYELKALKHPTPAIRNLVTVVCIILLVEPVPRSNAQTGFKTEMDYWAASKGEDCLGNPNVIKLLTQLDPLTLDEKVMVHLEEVLEETKLNLPSVKNASKAAEGLFKWISAVRNYYFVYKASEPIRDKLVCADAQVRMVRQKRKDNLKEISELKDEIEEVRKLHFRKDAEIKKFNKQIDECFMLKSKAARLLNELAGEKQKWQVCEDVANEQLDNIEGDSLMAAAMVCYLSPFVQKFRAKLYSKWQSDIEAAGIPITEEVNFSTLFSEPLIIKQWLENGLPNDSYSIQNAIILDQTSQQSVLIDPQTQANKWLRKELDDVKLLNMQTSRFEYELRFCLKFGSTVIIENVNEDIPRKLYPLFKFAKRQKMNTLKKNNSITLDGVSTNIDPHFQMHITSVLKTPDFGAELSLLANFINFSVTIEAFEAQVLSILMVELETSAESKQRLLRKQALNWLSELKLIEDDILNELCQPIYDEALIARDILIEKLLSSKTVSKQIGKSLLDITSSMDQLIEISQMYKGISIRAARYFFISVDLIKLNPMYLFTHEWFFAFFTKLMALHKLRYHNDQGQNKEHHIKLLQLELTRTFHYQVCQCMFEADKILFSFLLAYKELECEVSIDMRQVEFFIKGPLAQEDEIFREDFVKRVMMTKDEVHMLKIQEISEYERRRKAAPWITKTQWKELEQLSRIPPFNQSNLKNHCNNIVQHIEENSQKWQTYITSKQFLEQRMEHFANRDDPIKDMRAQKSKERRRHLGQEVSSDGIDDNVTSYEPSRQDGSSHSVMSEGKNLIKKVHQKRMLNLGVPGGYEQYNYKDAFKLGEHVLHVEQTIKERMKEGIINIMEHGNSAEVASNQRAIDDIFNLDAPDENPGGSSSEYDSDGDKIKKKKKTDETQDAYANTRHNNVEEDKKIAETVIQGIAEYTEFKVHFVAKESKKVQQKQFVINAHMVRLCLMRIFHPEKLMNEIRSFISFFLGVAFIEIPPFDFTNILKQTSNKTPVLFMNGPNVNCLAELNTFKENAKVKANRVDDVRIEYQPLGSIAPEKISKLIIRCACKGHWLLLDNLQLAISDLHNLEKFVENMYANDLKAKAQLKKQAEEELESIFERVRNNQDISVDDSTILTIVKVVTTTHEKIEAMKTQKEFVKAVAAKKAEVDEKREARENSIAGTPEKVSAVEEKEEEKDGNQSMNLNDAEKQQIKKSLEDSMNMSFGFEDKVKFLLQKMKEKERKRILAQLAKFEQLQKEAEDLNDQRVPTADEKFMKELVFPDALQFPIHKNFKLWMGTIPVSDFPASFARRCLKVSLELPTSIRPNSTKTLSGITSDEFYAVSAHTSQFRRLLFSMTVMHAVINQREKFNSFGWTKPYHFSPNDFSISMLMLGEICQSLSFQANFPEQLMQYLVGTLNYGGKITDDEDQIVLNKIVNTFITNEVHITGEYQSGEECDMNQDAMYNLCGTDQLPLIADDKKDDDQFIEYFRTAVGGRRSYNMPANINTTDDMRQCIDNFFPLIDMPQLFGLHQTATIKYTTDLAADILHRTYIYQFVVKKPKKVVLNQDQSNKNDQMVYEFYRHKLLQIIFDIPKEIDESDLYLKIPIKRDKPFNTLLTKEIQRYNILINRIKFNLEQTLQAFEGVQQHTQDTETTFLCLQFEKTPTPWMMFSFPSHDNIHIYMDNLNERFNYIKNLLSKATEQTLNVRSFWIPGFFNQKNLLTTLIQEVARRHRISIEQLEINYRIMNKDEQPMNNYDAGTSNSYYIYGLFIYGAKWDEEKRTIVDLPNEASEIGTEFPMLHLKIDQAGTKDEQPYGMQESSESPISPGLYQRISLDQQSNTQIYSCPMYVNFKKNRLPFNISAEGQVITHVPINLKDTEVSFWMKRNVALVCYNDTQIS